MNWFMLIFMATLTALGFAGLVAFLLRSAILNWVTDRVVTRWLKDAYGENLWDVVVGMTRIPPHIIFELEMRAEMGRGLERPLGTIRFLPDFAGVAFRGAQLIKPPLGPKVPIEMTTVLGPRAKRPLRLEMPIMVGGMGYAVALSKQFVLAMAKGASRAGTSYNAGSGPVLDEILQEAKHLVLQYTGGAWNRDPNVLAQADMIEIRLGHGGRASLGKIYKSEELPPDALPMMGLKEGGEAVYEAPLPGGSTPAELRDLVARMHSLINGGPVAVKLACTHDLEEELAAVVQAGADVIVLDGAQAGTHGAPPITADDFGLPTVHALQRAVKFLESTGVRKDISLVVGGGLRTPGEFLKAMALGADAVSVGTAVMMGGTHAQISKSVPFEPVTQICWAVGQLADTFDTEKGAETACNFLLACAEEMAEGARALGKRSIHEINRDDLIARDRETARVLGLPPSWRAARASGQQAAAGPGQGGQEQQPAAAGSGQRGQEQQPAAAGSGQRGQEQQPAAASGQGGQEGRKVPKWRPPGQGGKQQPGSAASPGQGGQKQPGSAASGQGGQQQPGSAASPGQGGQQQPGSAASGQGGQQQPGSAASGQGGGQQQPGSVASGQGGQQQPGSAASGQGGGQQQPGSAASGQGDQQQPAASGQRKVSPWRPPYVRRRRG